MISNSRGYPISLIVTYSVRSVYYTLIRDNKSYIKLCYIYIVLNLMYTFTEYVLLYGGVWKSISYSLPQLFFTVYFIIRHVLLLYVNWFKLPFLVAILYCILTICYDISYIKRFPYYLFTRLLIFKKSYGNCKKYS